MWVRIRRYLPFCFFPSKLLTVSSTCHATLLSDRVGALRDVPKWWLRSELPTCRRVQFICFLLCDETEIRNVCTQTKEYGILRAFFSLARWSKWLTAQFIVQLYLAQPRVMRSIKDFRSLTTSGAITQSSVCQVRNHDFLAWIFILFFLFFV